jgi:phage baseplate assembly protein W
MRQGLKYPITAKDGKLVLSSGDRLNTEAIFSVLETRPTERVERPSYGTPDFVFASVANVNAIPSRIEASLVDQIAEISQVEVTGNVITNERLNISITYQSEEKKQELKLNIEI